MFTIFQMCVYVASDVNIILADKQTYLNHIAKYVE